MNRKTNLVLLEKSPFKSISDLVCFFQKKYPTNYFYKPVGLELELTNLCNLQCEGCPIMNDESDKPKDLLTNKQYIDNLRQANKQGFLAYSITGGEPFLKLKSIQKIIKADHGLDIYKLNTNGSFFKSIEGTKKIFEQLKKSGFGSKNKHIKALLVISLGQQNIAGVPIINSAYATSLFYNYFSFDSTICCINLTGKDPILVQEIYKTFQSLYKKITNKDFDENKFVVRFFPLNFAPTLKRLEILSNEFVTIPPLLSDFKRRYLSSSCFNISIKNTLNKSKAETLTPRMMIRPNGDTYACQSYNRVHNIGNVFKERLFDVIKKANRNMILKIIYMKNLKGLYQFTNKFYPKIRNIKLDTAYSPCDICQVLTSIIKENKIL